jgi:hypothetical protein
MRRATPKIAAKIAKLRIYPPSPRLNLIDCPVNRLSFAAT